MENRKWKEMTSLLIAIRPDSQEALRSISNKMADLREELKEEEERRSQTSVICWTTNTFIRCKTPN